METMLPFSCVVCPPACNVALMVHVGGFTVASAKNSLKVIAPLFMNGNKVDELASWN